MTYILPLRDCVSCVQPVQYLIKAQGESVSLLWCTRVHCPRSFRPLLFFSLSKTVFTRQPLPPIHQYLGNASTAGFQGGKVSRFGEAWTRLVLRLSREMGNVAGHHQPRLARAAGQVQPILSARGGDLCGEDCSPPKFLKIMVYHEKLARRFHGRHKMHFSIMLT